MENLHPNNTAYRSATTLIIGFDRYLLGDRDAAERAYKEALSLAHAAGDDDGVLLATTRLGQIHELRIQLHQAFETYQKVLNLIEEDPPALVTLAYIGLARIYYEWNDLDAAEWHGLQALQLARQYERVIDRYILCEVFLARLKLAQGDVAGAAAMLAEAEQAVRQNNFEVRKPEVAAAQVLVLLRQGKLAVAADLSGKYALPLSQARVFLAQGETSKALALLEPLCQQMEAKGWQDELLKVMILQAIALQANGEIEKAVQVLGEAVALAEPGGCIRTFVDEGEAMQLLIEKLSRNRDHPLSGYVDKLLAAFIQATAAPKTTTPALHQAQRSASVVHQKLDLIEALSEREMEVLKLLRSDLSGPEIAHQLSVSINTFRTHTKNIFIKLGVNDRRAALRRAEELDLI